MGQRRGGESQMSSRILITGSGSGIGRAVAADLLGRGHEVIATDLAEESLADLTGPEGRVPAARFRLDVTDPADIERVRAAAGDVDVLLNSAGIGLLRPVELADVDLVRRADAIEADAPPFR
jgi:NADP-dependent 3-hydroxy acid dehydrogenase YdfG